jgi:hypothetical protein
VHFACHHAESAKEYEKHSTSASWIWNVDLVTGQIATLVEEDRYGLALRDGTGPLSLLVANWPPACIRYPLRRMKTIDWQSIAARFPAARSMRLKPGHLFEDPIFLALCFSTVIFALVGLVLLLSES